MINSLATFVTRFSFAVLIVAVVLVQNAYAQSEEGTAAEWVTIPGRAIDIAINEEEQIYALDQGGALWRWDPSELRWRSMAGRFVRISAAEGNRPWAVDKDGGVHRYNGLWWEQKAANVLDVAADTRGNVYIAKTDHTLWKWYALRSEWRPIPGKAVRIDIAADQSLWAVRPDRSVFVYDGNEWTPFGGRAFDLAAGPIGAVVIATPEGDIRRLNMQNRSWDLVPGVGSIVTVAITPTGGLWAVNRGGEIYTNQKLKAEVQEEEEEEGGKAKGIKAPTIFAPVRQASLLTVSQSKAPQIVAPPLSAEPTVPETKSNNPQTAAASIDPATISGPDDFKFVNTRKQASLLAIGKDGSVFGLEKSGDILRWSNHRRDFEEFPGSLVRIAVDPEGNPWGISVLGRVFRHDGRTWRQILGAAASDIAIGGDGSIIIANSSGDLFRFVAADERFVRTNGNGLLVAVDPEGHPWTIRSDQLVQRCDVTPCKPLGQKAISISIGPDGRVWIVSTSDRLMRLDEKSDRFVVVPTLGLSVHDVASGPNGFPWVTTADDIALSSRFFERGEAEDRATAAATGEDTVGTGATDTPVSNQMDGFTFTKNMRFETLGRGDLDMFDTLYMDAGNDGHIYAYNYSGSFTKFDEASKSFKFFPTQLGSFGLRMEDFTVESNGALWAFINDAQGFMNGLYRESNNTYQEFTVPGGENAGVTAAPDDTIYAIFTFSGGKQYLYQKAPNTNQFRRFSNYSQVAGAGVGPGQDVWIINTENEVMQWTGRRFERRPVSGQFASRISVGANGTVYITDQIGRLFKWNGANKSFDRINNVTARPVAVDDTGRPWIGESNPVVMKRAR